MHLARAAAPLLSVAFILAACSSGGATPAPTTSPTAAPSTAPSTAPSAMPAASGAAAAGVTIQLSDTSLGSIVTDGDGRTLYVFTADSANTSSCTSSCLDNWPPLTSDAAPTIGHGLDAASFGSITRADSGATQVTFDGHPLYYFAGDSAAGDTNGQGVAGKWFVIAADGSMVGAPAASSGY